MLLYAQVEEEVSCPGAASAMERKQRKSRNAIELSVDDLPAACPRTSTALWALHPRVFLDVVNQDEATCPYCGTRYRFRHDASLHDHQFGTRNLHQHRQRYDAQFKTRDRTGRGQAAVSDDNSQHPGTDAFGDTTLALISQ